MTTKAFNRTGISIVSLAMTVGFTLAGCNSSSQADHRVAAAPSSKDAKPQKASQDAVESTDDSTDNTVTDKKEDPKPEDKKIVITVDPAATERQQAVVNTGVRNFAQINYTMATLTGVPAATPRIKTFFDANVNSLPGGNDAKGFLSTHQISVFKLAVEYCDVAMNDATKRADILPGFNFASTPTTAFPADAKSAVTKAFIERFWGKGLSSTPDAKDIEPVVSKLIDDMLIASTKQPTAPKNQLITQNSATLTPRILTGVCSAILASAPVLFL
jgi:hypothetical protein